MPGRKYLGPISDDSDLVNKKYHDDNAGSSGASPYIKIIDTKASGTDGGTFTQAAWRTRVLNSLVTDDTGAVTLASNRFTLPAGTYIIRAQTPAYRVDKHMASLYNYTDAAYVIYGRSTQVGVDDAVDSMSIVVGKFTIAASKAFEIRDYCTVSRTTNGMGCACGITGIAETFTTVELWKVA